MELATLIALLDHPVASERHWAENQLKEHADDFLPLLLQALNDEELPLQFRVAEVLGRLADPRAIEPLCAMRQRLHLESRTVADLALVELSRRLAQNAIATDVLALTLLLRHLNTNLLSATIPIAWSLKELAEKQPTPQLRAALPWLKPRLFARHFPKSFREAYQAIDEATKQWKDLPLVSTHQKTEITSLPRPAMLQEIPTDGE